MKVAAFRRRVRWVQRVVAVSFVLALAAVGLRQSHAAPQFMPVIYNPSPALGATVQGPTLHVGATIQGQLAITSWQVTIDGQGVLFPPPTVSNGGLTVALYADLPLASGVHNVYLMGVDSSGAAGGYAWNFTVTNGGPPPPTPAPTPSGKQPSFSGLTPADGATVSGIQTRIAVTIASSATNLINESLTLDGRAYSLLGISGGRSETAYVDITGLSVGQHYVVAQAGDTAGNFNAQPWSFTVQLCPQGRLYFPQTARCVSTSFYQFWAQNGGLTTFGYPISDEIGEKLGDGKIYAVQYFERARFEYHPEAPDPYKVQLGLIGREMHGLDARVAPYNGRRYFQESGHGVADDFLNFWLNNGGVTILGWPISEEQTLTLADGKSYVVQYFERSRLERHPENAAPYNVLVGQLGKEMFQQKYPGK